MTANQIAYWNLEELKRHNRRVADENERHNRATEYESYRHSYAQEVETNRHNLMAENLENSRNIEVRRHNVTTERETGRANLINEGISQLRHEETVRYNVAALNEVIRHNRANEYANMIGVAASQMQAKASQKQAEVASRNVALGEKLLPYQQEVQTATANNINSQAELNRARVPGVLYDNQISAHELQTWNTKYEQEKLGRSISNYSNLANTKIAVAEARVQNVKDIFNVVNTQAKVGTEVVGNIVNLGRGVINDFFNTGMKYGNYVRQMEK